MGTGWLRMKPHREVKYICEVLDVYFLGTGWFRLTPHREVKCICVTSWEWALVGPG